MRVDRIEVVALRVESDRAAVRVLARVPALSAVLESDRSVFLAWVCNSAQARSSLALAQTAGCMAVGCWELQVVVRAVFRVAVRSGRGYHQNF